MKLKAFSFKTKFLSDKQSDFIQSYALLEKISELIHIFNWFENKK